MRREPACYFTRLDAAQSAVKGGPGIKEGYFGLTSEIADGTRTEGGQPAEHVARVLARALGRA
jgi:hypothetical protein